jgi:tetratricopeptide (TPR) repeat protein
MEPSENLYNELLSGNPSQGTYFQVLSRMKNEGMLEGVIDESTRALETYPDDIKIRRLLAEACFEAGRISRAESEIKAVIARINELMTCYRLQADMFISQGRKAEATEALKIYLIHCPDDKESYALLESMLPGEEIPAEALQAAEAQIPGPGEEIAEPEAQTRESELPDIATATLAEVYFKQGLTEEATEIYKKVVEMKPDDSGSRLRLEELKSMLEQSLKAKENEKDQLMRKRKMVSILESWLEGIRERSKTGLSAG